MSADQPNELVRGPKWRTRTSAVQRHRVAGATFALVAAVGFALMGGAAWSLNRLGAPGWVVAAPWIVPTVAVLSWTLLRATPAQVTDDDDDSWFGYTVRWALVGELEPRPVPARVVVAIVFGAPVGWSLVVVALATLLGII